MQRESFIWNPFNIITAIFLFFMIMCLLFLSAYNSAQLMAEGSTEEPINPDNELLTMKEILAEKALLNKRESSLNEKEERLKKQEERLTDQEASLNKLMEVRTKIIRQLVDTLSQSNLILEIDKQTGAIRFSDGIFFDASRDVINENGAEYLNEFIPAYFSILLNDDNREFIAEIIIEGHTDDVGSYLSNLELSQNRALAVARFILHDGFPEFEHKDIIHKYLTANGRSYSQPIMTNGVINRDKSRRVEFKFRLKDEETIKEMQQIFERTNR